MCSLRSCCTLNWQLSYRWPFDYKKDEFCKTPATLGWEAKWQERHLRGGFWTCPGLDADVNCPSAADLWKLLLFSFPLHCAVTTAQLILEVEKGWNEKSLQSGQDHCGECETMKTELWVWCSPCKDGFGEQKQIFFPLYKKKTWRDQSSGLSSVFSNIFSQPCKNIAFQKHCTQTNSFKTIDF